jgi:hypothetical protein
MGKRPSLRDLSSVWIGTVGTDLATLPLGTGKTLWYDPFERFPAIAPNSHHSGSRDRELAIAVRFRFAASARRQRHLTAPQV